MQISIIGYVYWHYASTMGIILLLSIPSLGWQSCACQRGYESTLDVNKNYDYYTLFVHTFSRYCLSSLFVYGWYHLDSLFHSLRTTWSCQLLERRVSEY